MTTAQLLRGDQVDLDDPRLASMDAGFLNVPMLVMMTELIPEAWFVEWPDGALGFAILPSQSDIADKLAAAYGAARFAMERRALDCMRFSAAKAH